MKSHFQSIYAVGLGLALVVMALLAVPAIAAPTADPIKVTSNADATGGPDCTLRDAIKAANSDSDYGGCHATAGADTIELAENEIYTLLTPDHSNVGLSSVASTIFLNGNGARIMRASNAAEMRIMSILPAGNLTIDHLTISGGKVSNGGAGIANSGKLTLNLVTVRDNTDTSTTLGGGGIYNDATATLTVNTSSFVNDSTDSIGGGIYTVAGGTVTIKNSTFQGNKANNSYAGAIFHGDAGTLTISQSIFVGNTSYNAGAIETGTATTVTDSMFSDNHADANGGYGGALYFGTSNPNFTLTVANTTFSNNGGYVGGGIFNDATAYVTNSTFVSNVAAYGGGIEIDNAATLALINSTFSGNTGAVNQGGALWVDPTATATIKNNIFANSTSGGNSAVLGTLLDGGGNVRWPQTDASCWGFYGDPKLGSLSANGGFALTLPLLAGSAAIDKGVDAVCVSSPVNGLDERGKPRPQGAHCDSGAFEAAYAAPTPTKTATKTATPTKTATQVPPTPTKTPTTVPCGTKPAKPKLASPAKFAQLSGTNVPLDWNDVSCTTRYVLHVKQDSKQGDVVVKQNSLTNSKFKAKGLSKGHTYYWFVKACNDKGCSKSATWKFTLKP